VGAKQEIIIIIIIIIIVQTGYGAHPASYPLGTGDSFRGVKSGRP
jgi:hypothetical protein